MATNKLLWSSKLIGVFFIMLVCTLSANAQFLRTSYFMEGTHYRQQLNPALTPTKGYFNLPVIGAVNATVGSTSLGYQDIIDIIDDEYIILFVLTISSISISLVLSPIVGFYTSFPK